MIGVVENKFNNFKGEDKAFFHVVYTCVPKLNIHDKEKQNLQPKAKCIG